MISRIATPVAGAPDPQPEIAALGLGQVDVVAAAVAAAHGDWVAHAVPSSEDSTVVVGAVPLRDPVDHQPPYSRATEIERQPLASAAALCHADVVAPSRTARVVRRLREAVAERREVVGPVGLGGVELQVVDPDRPFAALRRGDRDLDAPRRRRSSPPPGGPQAKLMCRRLMVTPLASRGET